MKQKRLTKNKKQEFFNTITLNNLKGDNIKNFIKAKGYSDKQAESFVQEYITKEEKKIIEEAVKEAETLWKEELKNEKYSLDTILDEDFLSMIEGVSVTKKILSPAEVRNKLIEFGYRSDIVEEFVNQYSLSLKKLLDGTFCIELNEVEIQKYKEMGFTDKQIDKIKGPINEEEINKIKEMFPELQRKKLESLTLVKTFPYKEWAGETDVESILCRWDGQYWYFGADAVPNRINLLQWKYGSNNVIAFLSEMGYLPPDDYLDVDL